MPVLASKTPELLDSTPLSSNFNSEHASYPYPSPVIQFHVLVSAFLDSPVVLRGLLSIFASFRVDDIEL